MQQRIGFTQDEVRRSNLSLVLTLIHRRGALSRSQITSTSELNRSTVGDLVAELAEYGLVRERRGVTRGVGRPSLLVEPVPESAVTLSFDVRVDRTVAAMVGLGGQVFTRQERRYRDALGDPSRIIEQMVDLGREVLADRPDEALWVGTGVGIPGIVRAEDGLVRQAPNLGWNEVPLGDLLGSALGGGSRDLWVRNDADLGVLAECFRGSAQGSADVVFLAGDVGIGGGVMVGAEPLVGAGGYGGEVGHMRVNPAGRTCRCGARGCWETEVGAEALVDAVRRSGGLESSAAEVIMAARDDDPRAVRAIEGVAEWLGLGLVNLLHLLNPQVIVLGGHLGEIYLMSSPLITKHLDRALPAARERVQVVPAELKRDATLIGGAEVAFTGLLDDPVTVAEALAEEISLLE